jgi:hypothetical protein
MHSLLTLPSLLHDCAEEGTPVYTHKFSILSASGGAETVNWDAHYPASRTYSPLLRCMVVNASGVSLDVLLNGVDRPRIPAGGIAEFPGGQITLTLTNNSGTDTVANEIQASIWTPPHGWPSRGRA